MMGRCITWSRLVCCISDLQNHFQSYATTLFNVWYFHIYVPTGGAGDRPLCRLFSIVFRTQTTHEQPHHIFAWRTHEHDTESGAHHQNHSSMVILPRNDQDNINYYQLAKQTGLQTFFNHCNALVGLHLNEVARSWCSHVFVFVFVIVFVMTRCRMNSKERVPLAKIFFYEVNNARIPHQIHHTLPWPIPNQALTISETHPSPRHGQNCLYVLNVGWFSCPVKKVTPKYMAAVNNLTLEMLPTFFMVVYTCWQYAISFLEKFSMLKFSP